MSKLKRTIVEFYEMDEMTERKTPLTQLHPLVKLLVTVMYSICVLSFDKYDIAGLLPLAIYPLLVLYLADISFKRCLKKLRIILPMVCVLGLFNLFFDRTQVYTLFGMSITGGMLSATTLILKGIYTLVAAFLLMATTGMERLCYALGLLRVPRILLTQILLVYRYVTVLLCEANAVVEAYSLRSPREKGVKFTLWGPFLGLLFLRSIARAELLYDSMLLRGFTGEFYYADRKNLSKKDYIYLIVWTVIIILLKNVKKLMMIQ